MKVMIDMPEKSERKDSISTKRLILRPVTEEDQDALFAIYGDAETVRYVPEEQWTEETAEEAFRKRLSFARRPDCFLYAITLSGVVIGTVSAWKTEMKDTWEIGFMFQRDHRKNGYAAEAARAVVEDLFEKGAHRIRANLDARNSESAKVCERIGMRKEAHFIRDYWNKGEWTDSFIYGMLKEDLEHFF